MRALSIKPNLTQDPPACAVPRLVERHARAGLAIVAAWVAAGCGAGSQNTDPAPVPLDDLPAQLALAICEAVRPCCGQSEQLLSTDACHGFWEGSLAYIIQQSRPDHWRYDPEAAGACTSALRSAADACVLEGDFPRGWGTSAAPCNAMFTGRLGPSQECQTDLECAARAGRGGRCEVDAQGIARCRVSTIDEGPRRRAGGHCFWTCSEELGESVCSGGFVGPDSEDKSGRCYRNDFLSCRREMASDRYGICTPLSGLGEPCMGTPDCREGTFCDCPEHADHGGWSEVCFEGRGFCVAGGAANRQCGDRLYCDGMDGGEVGICRHRLDEGSTCSVHRDSRACAAGLVCRRSEDDLATCQRERSDFDGALAALDAQGAALLSALCLASSNAMMPPEMVCANGTCWRTDEPSGYLDCQFLPFSPPRGSAANDPICETFSLACQPLSHGDLHAAGLLGHLRWSCEETSDASRQLGERLLCQPCFDGPVAVSRGEAADPFCTGGSLHCRHWPVGSRQPMP
jgi:hypothetical protein